MMHNIWKTGKAGTAIVVTGIASPHQVLGCTGNLNSLKLSEPTGVGTSTDAAFTPERSHERQVVREESRRAPGETRDGVTGSAETATPDTDRGSGSAPRSADKTADREMSSEIEPARPREIHPSTAQYRIFRQPAIIAGQPSILSRTANDAVCLMRVMRIVAEDVTLEINDPDGNSTRRALTDTIEDAFKKVTGFSALSQGADFEGTIPEWIFAERLPPREHVAAQEAYIIQDLVIGAMTQVRHMGSPSWTSDVHRTRTPAAHKETPPHFDYTIRVRISEQTNTVSHWLERIMQRIASEYAETISELPKYTSCPTLQRAAIRGCPLALTDGGLRRPERMHVNKWTQTPAAIVTWIE